MAPPQYSPDGRWWWNGVSWLPAPPPVGAQPLLPWVAAPAVKYAGFWIRLLAYVIDAVCLNIVAIPLNLALFGNAGATCLGSTYVQTSANGTFHGVMYSCSPTGGGFLIFFLLSMVYFTLMWRTGSTLGQRVLKIRVADGTTGDSLSVAKCLVRFAGFYVSLIPLAIGLIWAGVDSHKRGWHDMMANSVVLRRDA